MSVTTLVKKEDFFKWVIPIAGPIARFSLVERPRGISRQKSRDLQAHILNNPEKINIILQMYP